MESFTEDKAKGRVKEAAGAFTGDEDKGGLLGDLGNTLSGR